jgi:hypothetical protein
MRSVVINPHRLIVHERDLNDVPVIHKGEVEDQDRCPTVLYRLVGIGPDRI